jgi:hypothetical protein
MMKKTEFREGDGVVCRLCLQITRLLMVTALVFRIFMRVDSDCPFHPFHPIRPVTARYMHAKEIEAYEKEGSAT